MVAPGRGEQGKLNLVHPGTVKPEAFDFLHDGTPLCITGTSALQHSELQNLF